MCQIRAQKINATLAARTLVAKSLLDRFDDYVDKLFDPLFNAIGSTRVQSVPRIAHKWWVVVTSTMTQLVITDHQRCIVIAPTIWNKYIGDKLDVLLMQHHAQAVPIPSPHPEETS